MNKKYLLLALAYTSNSMANGLLCQALFEKKIGEISSERTKEESRLTPDAQSKLNREQALASGKRVSTFFKAAGEQILERGNVLNSLLLSMIAKEHLLMVGPPGNAKTTLTKLIFENIKEKSTGKESFFATQMTAETSLSDTHGGINYKTLQETGRQERLYEEGILGARVAMLDEQFDMRPNGYRNILDVLAERAHAQSGKKFKGKTWTVVGASNTFIPEVYAKFDGSDQPRALIDRYSYVLFIPAEMQKASSNRTIVQGAQRARKALPEVYFEDFEAVQKLVPEVTIPDYVSDMLSLFQYRLRTIFEAKEEASLQEYKEKIQNGEKPLPPYKSTKYMSGRTLGKASGILRAVVALDYAANNGQRKLSVNTKDLKELVNFYSLGGPDEAFIQNQLSRASKEVEKEQLKTILWERKVVRETLEAVLKEYNAKVTQMGSQDLFLKVKNYKDLSAGERRELIDTLRALYTRKKEIANFDQSEMTPELIAEVSVGELVQNWLKVIEPNAAENILAAWDKNAPITKKRNTDGRYTNVSETPSGSWSLMDLVPEKLKQVARDLIAAKEVSDLQAKQAAEKAEQDAIAEKQRLEQREKARQDAGPEKSQIEATANGKTAFNEDATKKLATLQLVQVKEIEEALAAGADPNVIPDQYNKGENWTHLNAMVARAKSNVELVKLFLSYGASTNMVSRGKTTLDWAKAYDNQEVIDLLNQHQKSREAESHIANSVLEKSNGTQPKYDAQASQELAIYDQKSLDHFEKLLWRGADPDTLINNVGKGWTALNLAIQAGKTDVAKLFLDHGARTDIRSDYGTAEELVIKYNQPQIAEMIKNRDAAKLKSTTAGLEDQASKNNVVPPTQARVFDPVATEQLKNLSSPYSDSDIEKLLQAGADPDIQPNDLVAGWTLLNSAAGLGKIDRVNLLLKYGARTDIESSENGKTYTALGWAKFYNRPAAVSILEKHEAEKANNSSVHSAANTGVSAPEEKKVFNQEATSALKALGPHRSDAEFEELLRAGADPDGPTDWLQPGWTLLNSAVVNGNASRVELLLKYGARTDIKSSLGAVSKDAMELAQSRPPIGEFLKILEMLKKHEAEKKANASLNVTPSIQTPHVYNHEATERFKALNYSKNSLAEFVAELQAGADPNVYATTYNDPSWTQLNAVVTRGLKDYMEELLKAGARTDIKSIGKDAVQWAEHYDLIHIKNILEQHNAKMQTLQTAVAIQKNYDSEALKEFNALSQSKWRDLNVQVIKNYIETKNMDPNGFSVESHEQRWTLLGIFTFYKNKEVIKYLLSQGANPMIKCKWGTEDLTVREWAVKGNNAEVIQIIEDHIAQHPELK